MADRNGGGIVETLIVLILISVLVVIVIDRYESVTLEARKVALQIELVNLRQAIHLYKMTKGKYPENLKVLMSENIVMPYKATIITEKYLEHYSLDEENNLLDPFDIPYKYDHISGRVWSNKRGFQDW